jgi:hypothetical protein
MPIAQPQGQYTLSIATAENGGLFVSVVDPSSAGKMAVIFAGHGPELMDWIADEVMQKHLGVNPYPPPERYSMPPRHVQPQLPAGGELEQELERLPRVASPRQPDPSTLDKLKDRIGNLSGNGRANIAVAFCLLSLGVLRVAMGA